MTDEEVKSRALTLAQMLGCDSEDAVTDIVEAMSGLVRTARREVIEECARVIESLDVPCADCAGQNEHDVCIAPDARVFAAAVRRLSKQEEGA